MSQPPSSPSSTHRVLDILANDPGATQREVARATGLSLGMVNAILRRLSKTGYIKIKGLTGRKLTYMLTTRGLSEKARRSAEYFQHTLKTYDQIRERLAALIEEFRQQGHRHFIIIGDGEVAQLAEMVIREKQDGLSFVRTNQLPIDRSPESLVLDCTFNGREPAGISVLSRLISAGPSIVEYRPMTSEVNA